MPFFSLAAKEIASLNPKFGDLKAHNSSSFDFCGSRKGKGEPSSPCSQIADIKDPNGSMRDLL